MVKLDAVDAETFCKFMYDHKLTKQQVAEMAYTTVRSVERWQKNGCAHRYFDPLVYRVEHGGT